MSMYLVIGLLGILATQVVIGFILKKFLTAQVGDLKQILTNRVDTHMRTLDERVRNMDPLLRKYETSVIVASKAADSLREQSDRLEAMYAFTGKTASVLARLSEQRKQR